MKLKRLCKDNTIRKKSLSQFYVKGFLIIINNNPAIAYVFQLLTQILALKKLP